MPPAMIAIAPVEDDDRDEERGRVGGAGEIVRDVLRIEGLEQDGQDDGDQPEPGAASRPGPDQRKRPDHAEDRPDGCEDGGQVRHHPHRPGGRRVHEDQVRQEVRHAGDHHPTARTDHGHREGARDLWMLSRSGCVRLLAHLRRLHGLDPTRGHHSDRIPRGTGNRRGHPSIGRTEIRGRIRSWHRGMPGGSASPPSASERAGSRLTEPVVPEHDEPPAPDADVEAASVEELGCCEQCQVVTTRRRPGGVCDKCFKCCHKPRRREAGRLPTAAAR